MRNTGMCMLYSNRGQAYLKISLNEDALKDVQNCTTLKTLGARLR
jgi:hypothetical protein